MIGGWRTALRIARREARRAKGRSAMVVLMITVPIAAASFLAVAFDSFALTPQERADRRMGTAQASISWTAGEPVAQMPDRLRAFPTGTQPLRQLETEPTDERLLALLPAGSRVIRDRSDALSMRTATGIGTIQTRMLDYADPLAHGLFQQLDGRAPAAVDEVALTPAAVDRLGAGIGGTVSAADGGRTFRVVGTVADPNNLAATTIVMRSQASQAAATGELTWLAATPGPVTWQQVKELNTHGVVALSRHVLANPPSEAEAYNLGVQSGDDDNAAGALALVAGVVLLEVVLLAGPAFAVSARRRRRELALVAATGASPRQVRRIVLADGIVLGSVAAIAGVALGIAAFAVTRPLIERALTERAGAFRIFPVAQAIVVALAVLTGVLAALVPAVISARQDVVAALAGRRGITRSRRRWPVIGLVLVAAGAAVAVVGAIAFEDLRFVLAGLVLLELGLVMCTPGLVGLVARIGRLLPLAPRIALRDTSRNRTAAASAISAVMAAVVGSMVIAIVMGAGDERAELAFTGRPGDVTVYPTPTFAGDRPTAADLRAQTESAVRGVLPVEQLHEVSLVSCDRADCTVRPKLPAAVDCPYSFDRLNFRAPTPDEQRAARQDFRCDRLGNDYEYFGLYSTTFGLVVVVEPEAAGVVANIPAEDAAAAAGALRSGAVVVDEPRYLENGRATMVVQILGADGESRPVSAPGFALAHPAKAPITMMTKATAQSLGLDYHQFVVLATTSRIPTVAEQDRLQAELGNDYRVDVAFDPAAGDLRLLVLAIVAAIIALAAAALATGLAAADRRADLGTLAAVGASPRLRRVLSLSQAGVIAGLGSLLGAAAGLGTASVVLFALNQRTADQWPAPLPYPITVPWLNLLVALVVVPAVAMLGAGLLTRSRLPIERRL